MSRISRNQVGIIALAGVGVVLGLALERPLPPAGGAPVPPIEISDLRGASGQRANIGEVLRPTVVMLSSKTCTYCKEALRDLSQLAGGRSAPGLWLVTLEGVQPGEQMLRDAGVAGARSLGPATSAAEVLLTFQTPGTPVFALLDSTGRTVRVVSGYRGRKAMSEWFAIMLGEGHQGGGLRVPDASAETPGRLTPLPRGT
jgi:hypothetical protein